MISADSAVILPLSKCQRGASCKENVRENICRKDDRCLEGRVCSPNNRLMAEAPRAYEQCGT